jgi:hypothetical protein
MDYQWHDLVGNLGVALILLCYFMAQTGRMTMATPSYSLLNGLGALLILVSLIYNFNLSSFLIEIAWLAISGYGLVRWYRMKRGTL